VPPVLREVPDDYQQYAHPLHPICPQLSPACRTLHPYRASHRTPSPGDLRQVEAKGVVKYLSGGVAGAGCSQISRSPSTCIATGSTSVSVLTPRPKQHPSNKGHHKLSVARRLLKYQM
jgi:hypothetical protein